MRQQEVEAYIRGVAIIERENWDRPSANASGGEGCWKDSHKGARSAEEVEANNHIARRCRNKKGPYQGLDNVHSQ